MSPRVPSDVPSESAARPSVKSPHVARREAPAVSGNGYGAIGFALFGASSPSGGIPLRGRVGNGLSVAHAETTVVTLRFAHPTHYANPGCFKRIAATKERGWTWRSNRLHTSPSWGGPAARGTRDAGVGAIALKQQSGRTRQLPPPRRRHEASSDLPARGRYAAKVEAMKNMPRRRGVRSRSYDEAR